MVTKKKAKKAAATKRPAAKKAAAAKRPAAARKKSPAKEAPATPAAGDAAAIVGAYQARRQTYEAARGRLDQQVAPLLRRLVAALFREKPGLNAVALSAYQDYDSSRLTGRAYVQNHVLSDDAWGRAGFEGECPRNDLPDREAKLLERDLFRFWPALQREHGLGWCIAFWRDPAQPDGVATAKRDHPGFN